MSIVAPESPIEDQSTAISSGNITFTTLHFYAWFVQMADAMKCLAANGFFHGDLAARNVFLCSDLTVKIGDFGLAKRTYDGCMYKISPLVSRFVERLQLCLDAHSLDFIWVLFIYRLQRRQIGWLLNCVKEVKLVKKSTMVAVKSMMSGE